MSVCVQVAGADDRAQVAAVLAAADLGSRQDAFLRFTLSQPALRTFLVRDGSRVLATALAVSFGQSGWIGNVAVHPERRRRGMGQAVTEAALAWLTGEGAVRVRLLATEMGRGLYERLGFTADGEPWDKYTMRGGLEPLESTAVHPAELAACAAWDACATGERRDSLLAPFAPDLVRTAKGEGYALALPWGGGPVVASTPQAGHALWWHVYGRAAGQRWAVPHDNAGARDLARLYRLTVAGSSQPMRYGAAPAVLPQADRIWAAFSLAVG